ncbi:LysR family transcriptional regulator [Azoarcus indigens]|uniref:LysR family transcriptional regulator n=1 Tax=Azoarcus indigens TaxID=29545 RepID=A0A4R6E191_9RHOO|nr:LysR substrate-binding domain-containing protein [Azoarcus indigens]NMG67452.1 LysR family transcriptional regulator [Azoarcus indigens]TDN50779.1 LysR family transcriptional regulator [Azoarcus indigens]
MSALAQLDIAAVRLLIAVAEAASISGGAARCHMSVAAASKRISDLEARLGVILLHRRPRGVALTPAGEVFVGQARQMAALAASLEEELRDYASGVEGRVRMVANAAAIVQFLPRDIAAFLEAHPRLRIDLEEQTSAEAVALLQTDRTDLAIFEESYATPGMVVRPYRTDELALVMPLGHPLAARDEISFADSLAYEQVGLHGGTAILSRMQLAATRLGRVLRLRIQVRSFDAVCRMIEGGVGVGVLPVRSAEAYVALGRLKAIPLRDDWARRRLLIGWPTQREPLPQTRMIIDFLQASAAADGSPLSSPDAKVSR